MQNSTKLIKLIIVVNVLLLTACSVQLNIDGPSPQVLASNTETTDLMEVTGDALSLAEQLGPENVLMVFDIDNTLMAMEQGLGADQWYEWQKELANDDRCNQQYVGDRFAVQGALLFASAMRPTQQNAARQVRIIQSANISVIALTSRGPDYRLPTFRELRRNGYNFTHSAIGPRGGYDETFIPVDNGRLSRYEDGVFMTAGQHKGEMLYALLQKTGTKMPKVILVADDKQRNLNAVMETFSSLGVPVRAWRYSGEDDNVAAFDSIKANSEWRQIEDSLRRLQTVMGADNFDLTSATRPTECH